MSTTVFNKEGKPVAQSHDMRAMLRGASLYGGVRRIAVTLRRLPRMAVPPELVGIGPAVQVGMSDCADVVVHYLNGYRAETVFVSHSHAVEWAFERSELSGRVSFFAGCEVFAPDADLDEFTRAYLVAAIWSSSTSGGASLDEYFDVDDIAPDWRAEAISDCRNFQRTYAGLLKKAYPLYLEKMGNEYKPEARAGHDFWLTRNGHGAGFWDRGIGAVGDELTEAAKLEGTRDIDEHDMRDPTACGALEQNDEQESE